jgi:hypothetical protein
VFKIDLHIHTSLGGDSLIPPQALIARARQVGLDAVCVTEHHSYALSEPLLEISRRGRFPIFRGLEYTAAEGHLLVFGVGPAVDDLPSRLPLQRVLDTVHGMGGVAVPAHPYQRSVVGGALGDRLYSLRGLVALETINGSASEEENRRAVDAADRLGIQGIGGSDAHGLSVLGRVYTDFPRPVETEQELASVLRQGGCVPLWNGRYESCHREARS